jgi:hypothetical protein
MSRVRGKKKGRIKIPPDTFRKIKIKLTKESTYNKYNKFLQLLNRFN